MLRLLASIEMEHGSTESSIHGTRTQDSIWSIAGRLVQKVWDLVMEVKKRDEPGRQRAAFADFLAREIGDRYAGCYAGQCEGLVRQDVDMRLYRMVMPEKYVISLPSDAPKLKCYKDIGEVIMHSDLEYIKNNISLRLNSVIYKGTIKYFV